MSVSSADADEVGAHTHFVLWCPEIFPDRIRISWNYHPLGGQGLAMVFFGAQASAGRELFSRGLAPSSGFYPQYHSFDVSVLHVSVLHGSCQRRKFASKRAFSTCKLRKCPGGRLVVQGADPLPSPEDADGFHSVEVCSDGSQVTLGINGLQIFGLVDDDADTGPQRGGGYLSLRQRAPLRAAWKNLTVAGLHRRGVTAVCGLSRGQAVLRPAVITDTLVPAPAAKVPAIWEERGSWAVQRRLNMWLLWVRESSD